MEEMEYLEMLSALAWSVGFIEGRGDPAGYGRIVLDQHLKKADSKGREVEIQDLMKKMP